MTLIQSCSPKSSGTDWIMAYRQGPRVGMQHTTNALEFINAFIKKSCVKGFHYPSLPALILYVLRDFDMATVTRLTNAVAEFRPSDYKKSYEKEILSWSTIVDESDRIVFSRGEISVSVNIDAETCTCKLYHKGAFCAHLYHLFTKGHLTQLPHKAPLLHHRQAYELYEMLVPAIIPDASNFVPSVDSTLEGR